MGDDARLAALARERLEGALETHRLLLEQAGAIARVGAVVAGVLRSGGKVLFCGNGGSAADAQHLACELVGRFKMERAALPALSLSSDPSVVTALANDYGYAEVFARQVAAHGRKGDALVGLSTSGRSPNVVRALEAAGALGMVRIALVGKGGGPVAEAADHVLRAPSGETPRIQECHILSGHILCEIAESLLYGG
mgnify:CR=1 FL=1